MWHSSSVGIVCPTGHNSNSCQTRFDYGACYFSDVDAAPNLPPHGIEIHVVDETFSDDDEDLFSRSDVGG